MRGSSEIPCEEVIKMEESWIEGSERLLIKKVTRGERTDAYSMPLGDNTGLHDHMWVTPTEVGYHPPKKP
jgi:hypothetical protein